MYDSTANNIFNLLDVYRTSSSVAECSTIRVGIDYLYQVEIF